ncbi:MAG: hypothetical protein AMXMBFR33_34130 [Candidatus Xenobia bacterium]
MKVAIIIESTSTGFSAYAPEVPGCVATGTTQEQCIREMQEALAFHYESMVRDGDELPDVTSVDCAMVDVPLEKLLAERNAA